MFVRSELKSAAKKNLSGNWGVMVGIFLIYMIAELGIQYLGESNEWLLLVAIIGLAPLYLSIARIALNVSTGEKKPAVSQLAYGFKNILKSLGLYLMVVIAAIIPTLILLIPIGIISVFLTAAAGMWGFILIGTLIIIIPAVIIEIIVSQAVYILADKPETGIIECLKESYKLTKGYKWNIFVLQLSFIGLALLTILTLGIGTLWLLPYIEVTNAQLYLYLKGEKEVKEQIVEILV